MKREVIRELVSRITAATAPLDRVAPGSSEEATRRGRDDEDVVGRLRSLFSAVWDGVFCGECGMGKKCGGILA